MARLVGSSPQMAQVRSLVARIAPSDATVLVRGESGTGKELVATAVHELSQRSGGPFLRVNCAAVVETLLASELFGHERGAFTGAVAQKKGWFELADGGTLFLDEIGDVSPKTQVALLRVLESRELNRVGGTEPVSVDVRVIAATNRDLEAAVDDGDFRRDLYYRLGAMTIPLSPLRARLSDIPELAEHLLMRMAREMGGPLRALSSDAMRFLRSHRWPGNVRELENVLRSAVLLSEATVLEPHDFQSYAEHLAGAALDIDAAPARDGDLDLATAFYDRVRSGDASIYELRKTLERESITRALVETHGNITRAAVLLGMKRPRLSQLIREHGIDR